MNDIVWLGLGLAVIACIGGFFLYHAYRGVSGSLANAQVGEVYNFDYQQPLHGDKRRVLARVIEPVYTLSDSCIDHLNRNSYYRKHDPIFQRTKHLVTCETVNGEIRQFYAERATNVKKSLLGGVMLKTGVSSLIF